MSLNFDVVFSPDQEREFGEAYVNVLATGIVKDNTTMFAEGIYMWHDEDHLCIASIIDERVFYISSSVAGVLSFRDATKEELDAFRSYHPNA